MNLEQLRNEVRKAVSEYKELSGKVPPTSIDSQNVGVLFDIYAYSRGVEKLMSGWEFQELYDNALLNFFSDKNSEPLQPTVISLFEFVVWLIRQNEILFKLNIKQNKNSQRLAFELMPTMNSIMLGRECLSQKEKLLYLTYTYCGFLETLANIADEQLLLAILKQNETDQCELRKKHIALGDFRKIIQKFENDAGNTKLSKVIDVEMRNKLLHFDFLIDGSDNLIINGKIITQQELAAKTREVGILLQFLILFYQRLLEP